LDWIVLVWYGWFALDWMVLVWLVCIGLDCDGMVGLH
jgi:hypothetical protein